MIGDVRRQGALDIDRHVVEPGEAAQHGAGHPVQLSGRRQGMDGATLDHELEFFSSVRTARGRHRRNEERPKSAPVAATEPVEHRFGVVHDVSEATERGVNDVALGLLGGGSTRNVLSRRTGRRWWCDLR